MGVTGKSSGNARKASSTKKSAGGKGASGKKAQAEAEAREKQLRSEVILLIILAFSIFLLIANFGKCGVFGNVISGALFGLIGFAEYLFPLYLFMSAAFLISNSFNRNIVKKVIYFGGVLVLASMLFQIIYTTDFVSVKELYMDGYNNHSGGGIICGGIFFLLSRVIGVVGVCIVMSITAIILFVLITGISIIDTLKSLLFISDNEYEEDGYDTEDSEHKRRKENRSELPEKTVRKKHTVSFSNLKVYDTGNEQIVKNDKGSKKSTIKKDGPRDFFDNQEEVHEINIGEQDFFEFNNGVEKIVMHDEQETDIPVRMEKPVKVRKIKGRPNKTVEDDIVIQNTSKEDVLAEAVNGNLHPESVSDFMNDEYDPYYDSAFSIEKPEKKEKVDINKEVRNVEKQINQGEKSYKQGAGYKFPTSALLAKPPKNNNSNRDAYVRATAIKLKNTLENFGVNVTITNYSCGPAVTRFEMQPEQGVKVSKILGLADDIKLNLAAADIRIEAPIPGKAAIGIEVPNKENTIVAFRELAESENFKNSKSKISFAVGKDISGQVIVTDIAKMPHLLIAGSTGSGKSVCINTLIMSILYKAKPEEVKLIMIDPKMVELACYNGIPHLLIPVVTDPKKASGALNWAVEEMTRRYQMFAEYGVRNIQGYNDKVEQALSGGELDSDKLTKMPQIVVIVDELADLMMVAHGEVEDAIVRLSQLARAAGIHLVIATQRPSVDVITGLIKANVPSRIAFAVSSGVDSRTILDMVGAEKLLGKGDMLFYPTGFPKPVRVQGAFISDDEVNNVVTFLKKNNGVGTYDDEVSKTINSAGASSLAVGGGSGNDKDDYFVEAGRFIIEKEKASIGMLQRAFKIGFNRAARIMDQLAEAGVVGPEEGTKARKILMSQEQFD
ncbi:MAG: DNA translocase FtsK 4TM domain-containing protein, partial [Coprococcus sp.]